ncbi:MAG: hypothetical protein COV70_03510 [Parcubacteria group bacterium CG11_big_fil_rev_8_21_14_0_20_39_22]|nr:MAG: hypothetical protein COV70_03510 [Parcubacteria group bacterium CG11_big_fil_rev_8_21_14_0_20_39_22]
MDAHIHYVCTGGCEGESSVPGICDSESCSKHAEQLTLCECEDGLHKKVIEESIIDDDDLVDYDDEETYDA